MNGVTIKESINMIVQEANRYELDSDKQLDVIANMIVNSVNQKYLKDNKKEVIGKIFEALEEVTK